MIKLDKNSHFCIWIQNKKKLFLSFTALILACLFDIHRANAGPFFDAVEKGNWNTVARYVKNGEYLKERGGPEGTTSVLEALVSHRRELIDEMPTHTMPTDQRKFKTRTELIKIAIEKGAAQDLRPNEKYRIFLNIIEHEKSYRNRKDSYIVQNSGHPFALWYLDKAMGSPEKAETPPDEGVMCPLELSYKENDKKLSRIIFDYILRMGPNHQWQDFLEESFRIRRVWIEGAEIRIKIGNPIADILKFPWISPEREEGRPSFGELVRHKMLQILIVNNAPLHIEDDENEKTPLQLANRLCEDIAYQDDQDQCAKDRHKLTEMIKGVLSGKPGKFYKKRWGLPTDYVFNGW